MSGKVEMKNLKNDLDRSKSLCARRVTLFKKLQNYDFLKKQAEEMNYQYHHHHYIPYH
jgi:hypothetical protein